MTSVLVYLLTYKLSTVRTQTLKWSLYHFLDEDIGITPQKVSVPILINYKRTCSQKLSYVIISLEKYM